MWTCPKCSEQIDDEFDSCWKCAATTVPDQSPQQKCCKCGGTQIASGKIRSTSHDPLSDVIFRPDRIRFLALTMAHGTPIDTVSYACLTCGTVRSQTNPDALRNFVQKHCKQPTQEESTD